MFGWASSGSFLVIGLLFYGSHFPEKWINYNVVVNAKNEQIRQLSRPISSNQDNQDENENETQEAVTKKQTLLDTMTQGKCVIADSKINYYGASHQIWHLCVNTMQILAMVSYVWFAEYRTTQDTCG